MTPVLLVVYLSGFACGMYVLDWVRAYREIGDE